MNRKARSTKSVGLRNEKLVLALLRQHDTLSQARICQLAHLSSSTVSYIVGRLREKGLITEKPGQSTRPGAKPVLLSINPQGRFVVGVEVNPSYVLLGLFDFHGEMVDSIKAVVGPNHSPRNVVNILEINLRGLLGKNNINEKDLVGTGITLSGSISPDGEVKLSSPLGWKNIKLRQMLESRLSCPVSIHTTRVRILAECDIASTEKAKNVLYVNVGNGVGVTTIIDGQLIHGATNRSGELGHMIIESDGPVCGCGHRGCLEALISGPVLAKKIKDDINAGLKTNLENSLHPEDLPEHIVRKWGQAVEQGDEYALEIRDSIGDYLSRATAIAINCFDPDTVILAGYVSEQCMNYFIKAIYDRMPTDVFDNNGRNIKIQAAREKERALIRGVAIAMLRYVMEF